MYESTATLRSTAYTLDSALNQVPVFEDREVFVKPRSVSRSDFYQAAQSGLKPSIVLLISTAEDYQGEKVVLYEGKEYTVLRVYQRPEKDEVEQVAKDTAKKLKQTSPKESGEYAKNWAVRNDRRSKTTIVYNKAPTYRLTHLLEKGHVIRNQYGEWGRTNAEPHIAPAEQEAVADLVKKVEEDIEKI